MKRADKKALVTAILAPYLTAKKDRTVASQYKRVAPSDDGVVRTVLSPVVTETGRLASGESFLEKNSTNLQNITKRIGFADELYRVRDVFIPSPGMTFIATDLDKADAIVVAMESEDWVFYEALISGADIHTDLAADAFHGGNAKSVTKHERQVSKSVTYASLYKAGVPRITRTINQDWKQIGRKLAESEITIVYDILLKVHPLEKWWQKVWNELMDPTLYGGSRWLENCLGFRRMFYNPDDYKLHGEAINFPPQSTVAGVIDNAMTRSWEELDKPGECEILLQVHDELIFQVRDDRVSHYAPLIKGMMQQPFECRGREVFIPSGMEVGKRWEAYRGTETESLDPENLLQRMVGYAT